MEAEYAEMERTSARRKRLTTLVSAEMERREQEWPGKPSFRKRRFPNPRMKAREWSSEKVYVMRLRMRISMTRGWIPLRPSDVNNWSS